MRRGNAKLDWHITDDDWSQHSHTISAGAYETAVCVSERPAARLTWKVRTIALLFVVLIGIGAVLWQESHRGLGQIEHELQASIHLEQAIANTYPEVTTESQRGESQTGSGPARSDLRVNVQAVLEKPGDTNVRIVDLNFHHDLAVITVDFTASGPDGQALPYRQLRFYRQEGAEWVRVEPEIDYFGKWQMLQTTHMTVHYRQREADLVAGVAAELDVIYAAPG